MYKVGLKSVSETRKGSSQLGLSDQTTVSGGMRKSLIEGTKIWSGSGVRIDTSLYGEPVGEKRNLKEKILGKSDLKFPIV